MEYTTLGRTGLQVSRIALGCMSYGEPGPRRPAVVASPKTRACRSSGRHSTRASTSSTPRTSTPPAAARRSPAGPWRSSPRARTSSSPRRCTAVMRPGPNGGGLSRKAILTEIDNSLRRLGTDYVDLYQIHRWDYQTPIEETLEALHDVVRAGKARYIGASSMHAWQFTKALYLADLHGWTRFVSMQNHYNLLYREEEREMIPLCIDQGVGIIPWSPLATGQACPAMGRHDESIRERRVRPHPVPARRPDRRRRRGPGRRSARHHAGPGGHRVGAGEAGDHGADRRRHQAAPPRRCHRGGRRAVERRRDRVAGEAVRAARGRRVQLR